MSPNEIPYLSATELGGYIAAREISPLEAVEAYLARIGEVDSKLNAYVTVCADQAREEARLAGAEIARGEYRGPLHGVPVGVKDQIYVKGVRNSDGSKIRDDFVPDFRRHGGKQPAPGRGRHPWQAEHERIRHGRPHQFLLWRRPQSLGFGAEPGHFQHRFRGGHRRVPVRHFAGRGHRRFHPRAGRQLRPGGNSPHLGPGQPLWRGRRLLVSRHHRPHFPHGYRLRRHHRRHCRL